LLTQGNVDDRSRFRRLAESFGEPRKWRGERVPC
jgi:hypothetical protein